MQKVEIVFNINLLTCFKAVIEQYCKIINFSFILQDYSSMTIFRKRCFEKPEFNKPIPQLKYIGPFMDTNL